MNDRSRDVSEALTEIRTVRSRAESAVNRLNFPFFDGKLETRQIPASMDEDGYVQAYTERYRDEDADEMVRLLQEFIDATERFARHTRKPGVINKGMGH